MSMTITEKILAKAAGKKSVKAGELVNAKIDVVMCHDVTAPAAISMLMNEGIDKVFDKNKIVVTPDHFQPAKDIKSAELHKRLDEWARRHKIKYYYKLGKAGVCHALLPEQGHIRPGEVIVGGDSHTCTYGAFACFSTGVGSTDLAAAIATGELWFKVPESMKFVLNGKLPKGVYSKDVILAVIARIGVDGALYKAMEFVGPALKEMSMEARMTMTNMAIEAGAKTASSGLTRRRRSILPSISKVKRPTRCSSRMRTRNTSRSRSSTARRLSRWLRCRICRVTPCRLASARVKRWTRRISEAAQTGELRTFRIAAKIMKGKEVKIRTIVVPATPTIWKQADDEGLFDVFYKAGCVIAAPTCGACLGGFMGILASGEKCISTTNRNFVGRMGHPKSEVYLASPGDGGGKRNRRQISRPETIFITRRTQNN